MGDEVEVVMFQTVFFSFFLPFFFCSAWDKSFPQVRLLSN